MVDRARRKLVINHVVFSSLDERPTKGGAATKAGELDDILKYGARQLFEEDEKAGGSAPACRSVSRVFLQFCGVLMSMKRGRDLCNSCGTAVDAACGHRRGRRERQAGAKRRASAAAAEGHDFSARGGRRAHGRRRPSHRVRCSRN
jgi:hypothetical protein